MAAKRHHQECGESFLGYICDVSPPMIAANNRKYFIGMFQRSSSRYEKFVCFDKEKHGTLSAACAAHTPLKLVNTRSVPSRMDSTKTEIILNDKTAIEVARNLNFSNKPYKQEKSASSITSLENLSTVAEYNKVLLSFSHLD